MKRTARQSGAVLLEVLLAAVLFTAAGAVIVGSLNGSVMAMGLIELESRAADLAITRISEMQMGLEPVQNDGPVAYSDARLDGWTWQVAVSDADVPVGCPSAQLVEVIIRNVSKDYTFRLVQMLPETTSTTTSGTETVASSSQWGATQ